MADRYRLRPASPEDAPALAALEDRCFPDPWSQAAFALTLASPEAEGVVVEDGGVLLGYVLTLTAGGAAEILNLAIAPEARNQGLASRLLEETLAGLEAQGVGEIFLEVRASNTPALALYRRAGFAPVGRRPRYYTRPVEDALVLRRLAAGCAEGR